MTGVAPSYREIAPHPALRDRIECYWLARGDSADRMIAPDGCVDFLFDASTGGTGARLVGAMTRPHRVPASHGRDVVAVRFRPGGANGFVRAPLHEFTDADCELAALGAPLRELARRGLDAAAPAARLRAIEQWLLRAPPAWPDPVDAVLQLIGDATGFRVDAAAHAIGCSRQYFARTVRARTGLSPKLLARVLRLRAVVAQARNLSGVVLAQRHGYADQAHLARDLRDLAGCTLTELRR